MLAPPIVARYIQINPIEWNEDDGGDKHDICMRAALYKCRGKINSVQFNFKHKSYIRNLQLLNINPV